MTGIARIAPFGLRIQPELMAWLRRKAIEQERSVNWVITKIVEQAKKLDEEGRDAIATF